LSIAGDIGTFAISPDVQHIAFTTLVNDRWQLGVVATQTHNMTMLTAEDCNAYHPSWRTSTEILYVTDCGRGVGLSALAQVKVSR
jgi:Tol biopolymer transport system component